MIVFRELAPLRLTVVPASGAPSEVVMVPLIVAAELVGAPELWPTAKGESEVTFAQSCLLEKLATLVGSSTQTPAGLCRTRKCWKVVALVMAGSVKQTFTGGVKTAVVEISKAGLRKVSPPGGAVCAAASSWRREVVPAVATVGKLSARSPKLFWTFVPVAVGRVMVPRVVVRQTLSIPMTKKLRPTASAKRMRTVCPARLLRS